MHLRRYSARQKIFLLCLVLAWVAFCVKVLLYEIPRWVVRPLWFWLHPTMKVALHRALR